MEERETLTGKQLAAVLKCCSRTIHVLQRPWIEHDYVLATDNHVLIRVHIGGWDNEPREIDKDWIEQLGTKAIVDFDKAVYCDDCHHALNYGNVDSMFQGEARTVKEPRMNIALPEKVLRVFKAFKLDEIRFEWLGNRLRIWDGSNEVQPKVEAIIMGITKR